MLSSQLNRWIGFVCVFATVASANLVAVKKVNKIKIDAIEEIYTRLELQLAKAESQNDIHQINCILNKVNLVKGLLKASQRSLLVITKAYVDHQDKVVSLYEQKIKDYLKNAKDLEASLEKCIPSSSDEMGPMLVLIRPESSTDLEFGDLSPWSEDYIESAQNLPVVPPASPFR
ncbi:MAG: hypothetical protein KDD48_01860 [Bdellovibrionales bacterium]|nr:hypothetical protein [Bdellovibrionales bacterium]